MRRLGNAIVLVTTLAWLSCGGSPQSNVLNGAWAAGLYNPDGTPALGFTATLTQNGSQVSVTGLSFSSPSSCFGKATTTSSTFTSTGTTHGVASGTFQMALQSALSNTNETNLLTLQGNFVRNSISGTWVLTGTELNCTGPKNFTTGDFAMTHQ